MVRCIDCQFFTENDKGFGGIGRCSKYEEHKKRYGKKAAIPRGRCLYPNAERECNKFESLKRGSKCT